MKRLVLGLCFLGLCFLSAATLSASTQEKITVTTLLKTAATAAGQRIVFPAGKTEVTALIVEQTGISHHGTATVPTRLLVIDQAQAGKGNQINR